MASTIPGFDEWLTDLLLVEAARAGESLNKFVARAVAGRIAVEAARRGDPQLDQILSRIRQMDLEPPAPTANADGVSVIADPARLHALYETGLLDAERSAVLDRVVEMAVAALAVRAAAVSLVDRDRVYLPSAIGIPAELALARQVPLETSLSRPIVSTGERLVVEDARLHPTLRDHPLVSDGYLCAFAGVPITDAGGHTIGTLSVWDSTPRQWTAGHLQVLEDFAELVRERVFGDAAGAVD